MEKGKLIHLHSLTNLVAVAFAMERAYVEWRYTQAVGCFKKINIMTTEIIKPEQFGKDHWSLLAYIECRVLSHQLAPSTGELNKDNLRINPKGDYAILATPLMGLLPREWQDDYGTRLWGFFKEDGTKDLSKQILHHDDVNCLIDFEDAKIIEIVSLVNFFIKLTNKGQRLAFELREWKNKGNNFSNFQPSRMKVKKTATS